ncbi:uncharacterized protein LOC142353296 [Convolutriloba macropyga]|uniref:uncharacterized protein LOC142353296 n=1 Tax=Convolutriloba macropyga TaxID=536237 RepID=UPI003F51EDF4
MDATYCLPEKNSSFRLVSTRDKMVESHLSSKRRAITAMPKITTATPAETKSELPNIIPFRRERPKTSRTTTAEAAVGTNDVTLDLTTIPLSYKTSRFYRTSMYKSQFQHPALRFPYKEDIRRQPITLDHHSRHHPFGEKSLKRSYDQYGNRILYVSPMLNKDIYIQMMNRLKTQ